MTRSAADEAVEALLVTAGDEDRRSFWRRCAAALKKAATATGQGTAWLARAGYDNRHYVPAAINGAIGDKLARSGDRLAIPMAFRDRRGDIDVDELTPELAAGNGHVVVLVHGLMGCDFDWREPPGDYEGLGPMLARSADVTPLYLRYNSGLHISQNGRELSALLTRLVECHGDRIDKLSFVGHSMGGLVVRSAGYYGALEGHCWVDRASSVVLLGTPNDGSYLEQLGHLTSLILGAIPNLSTRVIARVIDERSDGIKDMRHGLLVDEDWQRPDADRLRRRDRTEVPLMSGVTYHVAAGTIVEDSDSVLADFFGDGLIGKRSALGRHVVYRVFNKTPHHGLVARPEVQQFVSDALAALAALPPGE